MTNITLKFGFFTVVRIVELIGNVLYEPCSIVYKENYVNVKLVYFRKFSVSHTISMASVGNSGW